MGSPTYIQKIYIYINREPLMVPLEHHRLLLPQAVVAHHHPPLPQAMVAHHHPPLPQEVVVHPLPVPLSLAAVIRSSQHQPLLLIILWPTMAAEPPRTAPGYPHPGCKTICSHAHPVTLPLDDGVCPQNPLC
jgi:hypothetical protein